MTDTGTRTGIVYLKDDGSDAFTSYRTSIRNIVAALEAKGAQVIQQSTAPTPGVFGRFFKDSDNLGDGILYYDNGTSLEAIGTSSAVDAAANVGSLRTLGAGALQAAAGNHTHGIGAITGAGGAASLNVGTTAGTVAAGDHAHDVVQGTQSVTKGSSTTRTSTTTLADDPNLQLSLASAGTYRITGLLAMGGGATVDVTVGWGFSGTWTIQIHGSQGPAANVASNTSGGDAMSYASISTGNTVFGLDNSGNTSFIREELIVVVTAAGTVAVRWAQGASSPAGTTMGAGSTLIAERIA